MGAFKDLDDRLRAIRKDNKNDRFAMEAKSETEIKKFYNEHFSLNNNELSNRLAHLKNYDDKFKTCILPIMIAIVFGIAVAIAQAAISYQKASTVDVMYQAWEEASEKIVVTKENQETYNTIYNEYRQNVRVLYCILFILVAVVIIGVVVLIAPFDLWYSSRLRKSYQKNLEADYLEPIVQKRRADYMKSLQDNERAIKE